MCTVLLPPGSNPIAVKYIISHHIISYHISYRIIAYHIISYHNIYHIISYHSIAYIISYHIISTSQLRQPTRVECYEQLREFYQFAKWSYIKMYDRKPENQVCGCSRLLVQSVPSVDPWGKPPTRLKGPGLHLYSFTHTAGVRWSPGMRPTFILYTQQASKAVGQDRCCAQNVNLTKNSQQLTSASVTYTLYDNSTKQPPSKENFSAGQQFHVSFFFYSSKARRFIPYSQEPKPEYRSRCSCKTIGWTVRVSYPGRGESFFPSPKRPIQLVPVFPTGGKKRPGREVDQSPPSIAEVKNVWSYTSTSPLWLHGVVRDILTYICPPMDSFSRYEILRAVSLSI